MAQAYLGEIRMFGGTYAPHNWAFCDGQLLAISSFSALFSLLGTTYGGDGRTSFGVPDLRGRAQMQFGTGPGLTPRVQGQMFGQETVALTTAQIPAHNHPMVAANVNASGQNPVGHMVAKVPSSATFYETNTTAPLADYGEDTTVVGADQGHDNMMPSAVINFIICTQGVFPPRS